MKISNKLIFEDKDINAMSEEEQIEKVTEDGFVITKITNPSDLVQIAAVNQTIYVIKYINNPSQEVQLAAIKKNIYAIRYIKNPTKDVLITALLKLLQDNDVEYVERLMKKYSDRNYPEFAIIRQSIEADK